MKNRILLVAATLLTIGSTSVKAQNFPVGITSVQDSVKSLQVGIISSAAAEKMNGLQLSTLTNISGAPVKGVQISATHNYAQGANGLQLSVLSNVSGGNLKGLQLAAFNYADTIKGVQLGFINRAERVGDNGWQIGFFNSSHDYDNHHKIGLVNVNLSTKLDWMLFGGNVNKFNVAARFRNRYSYNILGFGTHYMGLDKKFSGALFYRVGLYKQLSPRWSVSADVGFAHVETFENHNAFNPERLFSLQARANVDFQFSKHFGAFATVGYGDTRYYENGNRYRNRVILEAGLTYREFFRERPAAREQTAEPFQRGDSLCAWPYGKHWGRAILETVGINVMVQLFDRWVLNEPFAQTTIRSIHNNFKTGTVWDNDYFITNMFAHPYHGNLYYNSARSNGLSFWESAPFALGGSLMWEFCGETEPPALNDLMATTAGGIAIGEVTHRLSDVVLDDSKQGWSRFFSEALATLINPVKGFNRIITGEAWRVRHNHNKHYDRNRFPLNFIVSAGGYYVADNGAIFRGEACPIIALMARYGNSIVDEDTNSPYDFFQMEANFTLSGNQPFVNRIHLLGRLWGTPIFRHRDGLKADFGIFQYFNYLDSQPVKDGTNLTPYRISEAASFGPGIIIQMPGKGRLKSIEQRVLLGGIILGGTKSDYFNVIERNYNMGSGFSAKTNTTVAVKGIGRVVADISYYGLFSWKGYECYTRQELKEFFNGIRDLHYINVQGDKSRAFLLVVNPKLEVDLGKNFAVGTSFTYYFRRTHYSSHPTVKAKTWSAAIGLTYFI